VYFTVSVCTPNRAEPRRFTPLATTSQNVKQSSIYAAFGLFFAKIKALPKNRAVVEVTRFELYCFGLFIGQIPSRVYFL
jgi:hypothetical protein